ncbi:MAG: right-handed parallel beta-helix repeat-containing protein [Lentisphaeria bacterium]|nr:right-handed parallel beta-helix repeat-containing protein [Lentisphaeria bacterium]
MLQKESREEKNKENRNAFAGDSVKCITEFGAVGDGVTLDTQAIQQTIDFCAAAGGGTVVVPAGVFLIGTIYLRSRITLHLEAGARFKGSPNIDDYCADDAYPQNWPCFKEGWRGAHLLVACNCEDVTVTGPGTIDGNCEAFFTPEPVKQRWAGGLGWARGVRITDPAKAEYRPGQMMVFIQCRRVRVTDLNLTNSPCWSCFLYGCDEVIVRGCFIDNPVDGINTDGIDIDCCTRVTVSDCVITTGDDAITLRASGSRLVGREAVCEDVTVSNCVLDSSVCAFRIGVGAGVIRHANISNIVIRYAGIGFLFQSSYGKAGAGVTMHDISVSSIRGHYTGHPARIVAGSEDAGNAQIRDIVFRNYRTDCAGNIEIKGCPGTRPDGISFADCAFALVKRPFPCRPEKVPTVFLDIARADGVRFRDCALDWREAEPEWRQTSRIEDACVDFEACTFPECPCRTVPRRRFLSVKGIFRRNIGERT